MGTIIASAVYLTLALPPSATANIKDVGGLAWLTEPPWSPQRPTSKQHCAGIRRLKDNVKRKTSVEPLRGRKDVLDLSNSANIVKLHGGSEAC